MRKPSRSKPSKIPETPAVKPWARKTLALMKVRGVRQIQLAKRTRLPQRSWVNWLRGQYPRNLAEVADRAAEALGTTATWLLDDAADLPAPGRSAGVASPSPAAGSIPPELWEVMSALSEPGTRAYLVSALRLYRQQRGELPPGSQPSTPTHRP